MPFSIKANLPVTEEKTKEQLLRERWQGQEWRIERIIESARLGEDWTIYLACPTPLPFVDEIAPIRGENCGRDLRGAPLDGISLREADLWDANIEGATGLSADQLGGANLCNATLPEEISKFEALGHVEEASKIARKVFLTILLSCVLAWLVIIGTSDYQLLTNASSPPLPIVGASTLTVTFFLVAPLLLLGIYVYFHLYLQPLCETLGDLPAFFPDGRPLDKTAYPWILNGLVRAYFVQLEGHLQPFFRWRKSISIFLAWWAVPLTILFFWWRYLYLHDWSGTCLHILLVSTSIVFGSKAFCIARSTLRGEKWRPSFQKKALGTILWIVSVFICILLSCGAIDGVGPYPPWARADFREADISTKPINWTGNEIALVKGAKLTGAKLNYCLAYRAFLIHADLRRADLRHADLGEADLSGAILYRANLRDADLRGAYLWAAYLGEADLSGANLYRADLHEADLRGVDLREVIGLTKEQIELAIISKNTLLPEHLEPFKEKILKKQKERMEKEAQEKR